MENSVIAAATILFIILLWSSRKKKYLKGLLYWEDFEKNWMYDASGKKTGYKYSDQSGCYAFFIYDRKRRPRNMKAYDSVYIGQSVHIHKRVHDHINGKGNGNIFADIREGKWVYVQFFPCSTKKMNCMEIKLIDLFGATESYNQTKGGGYGR